MAAPLHIELDRVDVSYSELVSGLKGVTLNIHRGELVFLVGQTGSGKSTLLKTLTREVHHTAGTIRLNGRDLGTLTRDEVPFIRRQMGIVPQDFGLLTNKKVWENVGYAMRAVGRSRKEVRRLVPKILEQVNILHRADAYPRELSRGEQQRVVIARSLINQPPLLLADEPTANLDPSHSEEIMALLTRLNEGGTTVVVATHDMPIVERFQRRIVRLEFGMVKEDVSVLIDDSLREELLPESDPREEPQSV